MAPKQEKKLFIKIDVPENEKESDYYFSIQFISKPTVVKDDLNYSQILGGVATNVLLSVGSKEKTQGIIEEFSSPVFLQKGTVPFTLSVKNTGHHFITPKGNIIIKNVFGQIVGKVDLLPVNILAESTRTIPSLYSNSNKAVWNENFILGLYRATLNIALSDQGPVFSNTVSFFALPTETIIAILIAVFTLVLLLNRVKKRLA